jgi:hypothetical protein
MAFGSELQYFENVLVYIGLEQMSGGSTAVLLKVLTL